MTELSKDSEMTMMLLQQLDVDNKADEEKQRETKARMVIAAIEAET